MSSLAGADTGTGLPLASLLQIDEVCDRFEAAWRTGGLPDLSSSLDEAEGPARARLFDGLLTIELESRLGRGEAPDILSYNDRFPEYRDAIAAVFAGCDLGMM